MYWPEYKVSEIMKKDNDRSLICRVHSTSKITYFQLTGGICQINPASKCRAYFRNFYFNVTTSACQPIVAGGCHPSGWNGFPTMEDCNRTCSGRWSN